MKPVIISKLSRNPSLPPRSPPPLTSKSKQLDYLQRISTIEKKKSYKRSGSGDLSTHIEEPLVTICKQNRS